MNFIGWLQAHQSQLGALLIAGFLVGTAKKLIPKIGHRERGSWAKWASFVLYILGGLALAVGMIPLVNWLVGAGAGSIGGQLISGFAAVVTLALGWHAIALLVSMIRDLADHSPDHEARTAALWVPTLLPIGGAAVWQLVQNPQGIGQGITAAAMGIVTLIYAGMIVKRADKAGKDHKSKWNWFAFGVYVIAGLVIIPLVAYADTALIAHLPGPVAGLVRLGLGLAGLGMVLAGLGDILVDRVPDQFARAGARFGIALTFVFGGIGWAAMTGATADGASFLNGVF
jgi:hypothetical protein